MDNSYLFVRLLVLRRCQNCFLVVACRLGLPDPEGSICFRRACSAFGLGIVRVLFRSVQDPIHGSIVEFTSIGFFASACAVFCAKP